MILKETFENQLKNRWTISQSSYPQRVLKLKKLKKEILNRREEIKEALFQDFKKPYPESELTEIHVALDEINIALKNLKKWMKPKRVSTPLVLFGAHSKIVCEAKGVVLILSPWNYPFNLLICPLVAAVAAGNCVIARPSEKTPHIGKVMQELIQAVFDSNEVALVLGDIDVAEQLLTFPFDHIFFTGSTQIGKKVMQAASQNLATVTLELGGKSPVIIDRDVDLEDAAQKITWGKFLNGGQTCVAPDYVFVPFELKDQFIKVVKKQIIKFYGETINDRMLSQDFARLVDQKSFQRLNSKLLAEKNLLPDQGFADQNYLPPTLFETTLSSPIMEDEIFGPILPIITYQTVDEVINHIQSKGKPLALYIFSKKRSFVKMILQKTSSGGVVVNHLIMHLANSKLPFGGVGTSGNGSYHGFFGFKAFSHERAVLIQGRFTLTKMYFPPYSTWLSRAAFKLLQFFE